jgi:energy-coupling factor transport system ATP-binding protein
MKNQNLVPHYPQRLRQNRSTPGDTILAVKDLSCLVDGRSLLKSISLEFKKGETVAIVGENGAGKTTLIKHFNGLMRPTGGEVILYGQNIRRKSPAELARRVGVCFQNPNDQFFKVNVRDELMVGLRIIGKKGNREVDQVSKMLSLHGLLDRSPYRLSEGEKKRVAVASILAMQPDILVLDEPTVGQDGRFKGAMAKILEIFENQGITTIIVTHDLDFAQAAADRWIVMHDGQVMADGLPEDIRYDEQLILNGVLEGPADK